MRYSTILQIEAIKFFTKSNLIILLLIPLIASFLAKINMSGLETGSSDATLHEQSDIIKTFANAFALAGLHYVAFSVISSTGREFTTGILRRNIIDGYTRKDIIISRIFNVLIHVVLTATIGAAGLLIFLITEDAYFSASITSSIIPRVFSFIFIFSAYGILAVFLVILLKEPIKSLLVFTSYRIVEKLLATLDEQNWHLGYTEYLPTNIIDQMGELTAATGITVLLLIIYILIALYLAFFVMSKCEL